MPRRTLTAIAIAVLATLSLSGCLRIVPPAPAAGEAPAGPASSCAEGEVRDADGACIPGEAAEPAGGDSAVIIATDPEACTVPDGVDLEGYFDEAQMLDFLDCVVPATDGWIDTVYADMPHPQ